MVRNINPKALEETPMSEYEKTRDAALCVGLPFMNSEWIRFPKDQGHMIKSFKHTHGFGQAQQAIDDLVQQERLKAKIEELTIHRRADAADWKPDYTAGIKMSHSEVEYRIADLTKQLKDLESNNG